MLDRTRHALEVPHRAQADVEIEHLAQRDVERADAAADRRGQRPLDPDQVLLKRLDGLVRQPVLNFVERLLAGKNLHPGDLALAAVNLFHRLVEDVLRGAPDVRAGAVALDKGMIGRSGTCSLPSASRIFSPSLGTLMYLNAICLTFAPSKRLVRQPPGSATKCRRSAPYHIINAYRSQQPYGFVESASPSPQSPCPCGRRNDNPISHVLRDILDVPRSDYGFSDTPPKKRLSAQSFIHGSNRPPPKSSAAARTADRCIRRKPAGRRRRYAMAQLREYHRRLYDSGYVALHWPKEYGGGGGHSDGAGYLSG